MSLRALLMGVAGALMALALLASTSLVVITTHMERNSARLWESEESVRTVEQLENELLLHGRARRMLALTGYKAYLGDLQGEERKIRKLLDEAHGVVGSPAEAALLEQVIEDVTTYLRLTAKPPSSPQEQVETWTPVADRALRSAERFVAVNLDDAHAVADETHAWERVAKTLGLAVAIALLGGVGLGAASLRRYLYRPLLSIRRALVRFRPGATGVVAPEVGPVELREIAQEFNAMAQRLERHHEVQLGFIAGVAHDLRNPLSALKLGAASVRPDKPLPSEDKVRERFALMVRQTERLERMVGDLLDTARIEAGHLELVLERQDLLGLVRESIQLHQGLSPVHELCSQLPAEPVWVRCDGTRISQVLNNLLSNAIKYSPQGGRIRVEVMLTEDLTWVSVTDSGIGIPGEELETIFEPFRRSASTRATIPGVGLGLSVARRIIEAHGGRIEVTSTPGRGSTFRFSLPRQAA